MKNDLEKSRRHHGRRNLRGIDYTCVTTPAPPVALAGTGAVISKFNRDTMLLTVGLVGTIIFAGLVLVAQDLHPKTPVVTDEATQTGGDFSLNANLAALSVREDFDAKNTADLTSGPATSLDEGFNAENSQRCHTRTLGRGPRHIGKVQRE
jgi:hypothetical protein